MDYCQFFKNKAIIKEERQFFASKVQIGIMKKSTSKTKRGSYAQKIFINNFNSGLIYF